MILVTAKNVSDAWFAPSVTMIGTLDEDELEEKDLIDNGRTYKSGTYIKHGVMVPEVRLHTYSTGLVTDDKGNIVDVNGDGIKDDKDAFPVMGAETVSDFATFEDAVAEINNLNRFKTLGNTGKNSKYYEDYDIEIVNAREEPFEYQDVDENGNPVIVQGTCRVIDVQNVASKYQ